MTRGLCLARLNPRPMPPDLIRYRYGVGTPGYGPDGTIRLAGVIAEPPWAWW